MAKYVCQVCGFEYDEDNEDQHWDDLGDDWACPVCDADKSDFDLQDGGSEKKK